MKLPIRSVLATILPLFCGLSVARADVVTLQASKDATLYEDATGSTANGSGQRFFAGRSGQGAGEDIKRGLLAFDVNAAIPPGSVVNSVSLRLYMSRTQADVEPVTMHLALADWGEGASVAPGQEGFPAPAENGDATWLHTFYPNTFWATPGGDFDPVPSATVQVGGTGYYTFSNVNLAADVQLWVDAPATNAGWAILGDETDVVTAKRFDGKSASSTNRRPELTIDFTPGSGGGACCLPSGACLLLSASDCALLGGAYNGVGTVCSPNPCPQPLGACCFNDGTCQQLTAGDCASQGGNYQGGGVPCSMHLCPLVLVPFVDPLPLPAVAQPVVGAPGAAAEYAIPIVEVQQQLHRDLPPTTLWTYGGTYPGPTIEAAAGELVRVRWISDLRDSNGVLRTEHLLPVDTCLHGPNMEGNNPRTVVHLHGAHTAPQWDGYPEDTILPGQEQTFDYPNHQLPAALWYHDHALGITRLNVWLGLAGLYTIRDAFENALGLPAGRYEVPLVIQDRSFAPDGSLLYPATWEEHAHGDTMLVNGKVWPYHIVERGKYRFRILNGCNSRTLSLSLSPSTGASFQQIGADGGLLPAPVALNSILLAPAERADVIVDFSFYAPGTEVLLVNSAPAPYPNGDASSVVPNVMKFIVGAGTGFTGPIPTTLRPREDLLESAAVEHREFRLAKVQGDPCTGFKWLINGMHWDHVSEYPALDTIEVWGFVNQSAISHPMHMHLVMFQVLDRQDFTMVGNDVVPTGPKFPPRPGESGWKDTVDSPPFQITRVIARFERYSGRFAYHCHILEHEDHEMMRQFEAVPSVGEPYCYGLGCPCANDHPQAGCVNGTGGGAVLFSTGSPSVAADDLVLTAVHLPPNQPQLVYMGAGQIGLPFGNGLRCVGAGGVGLRRFAVQTASSTGTVQVGPGMVAYSCTSPVPALCITPGSTWNFQSWYRDPVGPCGSSFNFSNALRITFEL